MRIHPSSLRFDCHVLSWYAQSIMPIHQHPEDNWLQQFENRIPYFQQLLRRVFNGCKIHVVNGVTSPRSAEALEQMAS